MGKWRLSLRPAYPIKTEYRGNLSYFSVLRFFTILPAPAGKGDSLTIVGRSLAFFPLVGLKISLILAILYWSLGFVLPSAVTAALIVAALAVITGTHHIDGLADTCDALVTGRTKQQRLEIMQDTKTGTFGIAAISLVFLIKYAAISVIADLIPVLIFPVLGRWALSASILMFPAAKKEGSGYAVKSSAHWSSFIWATVISLILLIPLLGLIAGPLLMAAVLALTCLFGLIFFRLLGGLTGDSYGATVEIIEAGTLLLLLAQAPLAQIIPMYHQFQILLPGV